MNSLLKNFIIGLKGFGMGAANVIPGVSGGTIALLTGIYSELIESINSFSDPASWKLLFQGKFKEFWKYVHGSFLTALMLGVLVSVFSLAKLMKYVIVYHPVQTWAFFFGLIVASAYFMLVEVKKWKFTDVLFALFGVGLGLVICTLSPTQTPDDLWFIFICGAIAVCTMILPGISGSFILVILSKYEYIMDAISNMNIPVLAVFGIGCVVGIVAFSKFLHWLLGKAEKQTMLVLVGFVIGSLVKVWPWSDKLAVITADYLGKGMEQAAANTMASAVLNTCEVTGTNIGQVVNLHVGAACTWAIAGLALVAVLEFVSKRKA